MTILTREYTWPYIVDCVPWGDIEPHRSYPGESLPRELKPWYVYLRQGGHQLLTALGSVYSPGSPPENFLITAPVQTVIRTGWTTTDQGFILSDLDYVPGSGVSHPPQDLEF